LDETIISVGEGHTAQRGALCLSALASLYEGNGQSYPGGYARRWRSIPGVEACLPLRHGNPLNRCYLVEARNADRVAEALVSAGRRELCLVPRVVRLNIPSQDLIRRPLIILSAPRAGSTMLFETFSASPELWTVGGESHEILVRME